MQLCSLNVNGIKYKPKRNRVIEWVNAQKCSICFLQETHFNIDIENEIRNNSNFDILCSNGTTASRGVSILIKKTLNYRLIDSFKDDEGRIVMGNVEIDDNILTLLCLYAPNCRTNRNTFFKKVNKMLTEHGIGIPILGGDFNDNLKPIDRKSS